MGIILGYNNVNKIYYGSSEVSKVYLGTSKIYPVEPDSFIPNPDFTTFNNYQGLTSGNGRYLAYGNNALPLDSTGHRDGCKIDYGQMISTELTGVQVLRIVIKNFTTQMFRMYDLDVVSSIASNSTNSWDYVINTNNEIEYGTGTSSFDAISTTFGATLYLDVCWGSNTSGTFPNKAMSITSEGLQLIGSGTSGRTFFNNPSLCGIGYKVKNYSASTQWKNGALDLYESGWYRAESLDAYNENPLNVTLVKRIAVSAS